MHEYKDVLNCPSCKSSLYEIEFNKGKFLGKKCSNCSLIYLSPNISNIESIYNSENPESSPSKYYEMTRDIDYKTFVSRLLLLEKYAKKESILDIGCNVGTFLEAARDNKWSNILGIEPIPSSAKKGQEKNIPIINDFFTKDIANSNANKFDAVYLGDVIEHLANPNQMLSYINIVLKQDGFLMIVTPNYESLVARFLQYKPHEHILYFTKYSLENILKSNNYCVIYLFTTTRARSIKAMKYSTTFKSHSFKSIISLLSPFDRLINLMIKFFVRDEIILIAKKI